MDDDNITHVVFSCLFLRYENKGEDRYAQYVVGYEQEEVFDISSHWRF